MQSTNNQFNNNQYKTNQFANNANQMDTSNVIHTHTTTVSQTTMSQSLPAAANSNPNFIADKPIGGSFSNNLERDRIASQLGSVSSGSQGFYIGQDFYNPQLGLKGLKLTPARRSLLDDINGKKWKKLSKVGKNDLHDRSAPNFYIRENSVLPDATPARKNMLADIDGKKWKKLSKVGKNDLHDRSGPQLHLRSEVMPDKTPQSRALMADIDGKKWKKLSAVPKDRMRDRSAPNFEMWRQDRGMYNQKFQNAAPVQQTGLQSAQPIVGGTLPPHLHSDLNSSFPVAEGHSIRHANDAPAAWTGNTLGEKMSSLGKGFTGWIKEEAAEMKQAVTGLGKKNHDQANLRGPGYTQTGYGANTTVDRTGAAVPADLTAPGSSVQSGLKQNAVIDNRTSNDKLVRATDKTIY